MENRFDLHELSDGHEERFEAKLEARLARRRRRVPLFWASAAAAVLVLILWIGINRPHFRNAHTPEAVYCAYLDKVGLYYERLGETGATDAGEWEAALMALTDETIPLFDQLPDEMSSREKVKVLKRYYGNLLDGVALLSKDWNI